MRLPARGRRPTAERIGALALLGTGVLVVTAWVAGIAFLVVVLVRTL